MLLTNTFNLGTYKFSKFLMVLIVGDKEEKNNAKFDTLEK